MRRFAARVASETVRLVHDLGARHLTIVAAPKMLGFLRSEGPALSELGIDIRETSAEVSRHSATELQAYLEKEGFLPAAIARAVRK
jgi:protein required for attachment to host cells